MIRPFSTRSAVLGLAAALVLGPLAIASPAAAASDTTPPSLAGAVSFAPSTVDVTDGDGDATVSLQLTDNVAVSSATLTLVAPGGSGNTADVSLARTAGTVTNGTWTGTASFSSLDYTGKWLPYSLSITDTAPLTTVVTGSALGTAGVTVNRTADTVGPTLLGATTSVTSVNTTSDPVDAVVRVSASDNLSGVRGGTVTFASSTGDEAVGYLSGDPVLGTSLNGSWDVPVTFPARSARGIWRLTGITLSDGQFQPSFYDLESIELPSLSIRVVTADDTTAPTLTSFSVGPATRSTYWGTTGYVYAQVGFADAVSGVASVRVTLQRPSGAYEEPETVALTDPDVIRTGTSTSGTVSVPIYVEGFTTGTWKVSGVVLTDAAGNDKDLTFAQLPGTRTSFVVSGGATDTLAPTFGGLTFTPSTVDTRGAAAQGSVLVAAVDPDAVPSGVASGVVTLMSPSGDQLTTASFTSDDVAAGDQANGTFRAGFTLPADSEDGQWRVISVTLVDAAARSTTVTRPALAPTLTVLGRGRVAPTKPGAPLIGLAAILDTTATVVWTPPLDTGGAALTGYTVSTFRAGTLVNTTDTTGLSLTVPNLVRGQSYSFTVGARNSVGLGTASALSNVITVPAALPGTPTVLSATLLGTVATVVWLAPLDLGGAPITGYVVSSYVGTVKQSSVRVGPVGLATFTGLAPGRTYSFKVAATNSSGDGPLSQASNTVSVDATVPAAPNVLSAVASGTSATVKWTVPADGGAAITGYEVAGTPAGSCTTTTGTSCVVSGLTPDTSYSFVVKAKNSVGTGAASAPSAAVVPTAPAPVPTATTLAVTGAPTTVKAGTSVTVSGRLVVRGSSTGVPGQPVKLQYRRAGTNDAWVTRSTANTGKDGSVRIAGLRPAWSVQVRLTSAGSSAYTATATAARTITVTRVVTLGSKTTKIKRGKTVTLTGRASPMKTGDRVTLQVRSGGKWKSLATKRVTGNRFAFTVRASKRGTWSYRVIAVADRSYAVSVSNARTLRVR